MKLSRLLLTLSVAALASPSFALNILLTNDDGVAAANLRALYAKLKAAGHDVIVSAPCQDQSGKGASMNFLTPLTPLTKACRGGLIPAGSPGAGKEPGNADFNYVDGTPVMATLYGLDVLAPARWGKAPYLVISGPNEGQNVGSIVTSSGTVSNAIIAAGRGLPTLAFSADTSTKADNTAGAIHNEVASLVQAFIIALQKRQGSGPLLPTGVTLNINFPKFDAGTSASLPWTFTRFGSYNSLSPRFVADLSQDPVAKAYGLGAYAYPGISFGTANAPTASQADNEAAANAAGKITVTAMQVGYEARPQAQQWLRLRLRDLLK
ncbi:5'/3'-nucleotidase SurE [Chitinimonas naiadis]